MTLRSTKQLRAKKGLNRGFQSLNRESSLNRSSSLSKRSTKQKEIEKEYNKNVQFEEGTVCSGCGHPLNLSRSHLIPRSRSEEFIALKKNVKPHCLSRGDVVGCHDKWESHRLRKALNDYEENMNIIFELDEQYYHILKEKEKAYYDK